MTVSSQINRNSYNGNGVTTGFATTFAFMAAADLVVVLVTIATGVETPQSETTHYTVSGGGGSVGTVTMLVAPPVGTRLVIYRDPALTQAVDLVNGSALNVETQIESPLDKLTMIAQRSREISARALRQPEGDATTIGALPPEAERANKPLWFDGDGNPVAAAGSSDIGPVTTYAATLLDDVNAAAARATLGAVGAGAITAGELTMATDKILGRDTTGTGAIEELGLGAGLAIAGGNLTVSGRVAQVVSTVTGAVATGTTQIPFDDSIPQNTEGDEYMTRTITPTNAASKLVIDIVIHLASSVAGSNDISAALFKDAGAGAIASAAGRTVAPATVVALRFQHVIVAGGTAEQTFKVRGGCAASGTTTFNGVSGGRLHGGVLASSIVITEYAP